MKKLFALMLALCLMIGVAVAEESLLQGEMVALDTIGLQMFIPSGFVVDENATADEGTQMLYAWKAEDGSEDFLRISAANMGEMTLDGFLEIVQAQIDPQAEIITLESGLNVIMFTNDAEGTVCAALVDTNNNVIGFEMGPTADQRDVVIVAFAMLISTLSPIQ